MFDSLNPFLFSQFETAPDSAQALYLEERIDDRMHIIRHSIIIITIYSEWITQSRKSIYMQRNPYLC
ncbi:hypothetical protein SAMN04487897_12087 [Paenibacillus sp. yr247]|nr:hypothetical protein SAMN04487897_12087 [Paenibacillus sp. yr247]